MDLDLLYDLPRLFGSMWAWCASQDPRIAFVLGAATWFAVGRIFSLFGNPVQKALALAGFVVVAAMALAFWVSFAGVLEPGEIPFGKAAATPNVDTLKEIRE